MISKGLKYLRAPLDDLDSEREDVLFDFFLKRESKGVPLKLKEEVHRSIHTSIQAQKRLKFSFSLKISRIE